MSDDDMSLEQARARWEEPGCHVDSNGVIRYDWPPQGRFVDLWKRFDDALTETEKHELLSLVCLWRDENSTLVSIIHEDGTEEDLEPDWEAIQKYVNTEDEEG